MSTRTIQRAHARNAKTTARRARRAALGVSAALGAGVLLAPAAHAANFPVTNLNDSGAGSLRDAITDANSAAGADTITFQSSLSGTINVASALQSLDELTINGPGSAAVTLDGADANRILFADSRLSVSDLSFANGNAGGYDGGAIAVYDRLTLDGIVVTSSSANRGGGVFVGGNDIRISDSRFSGNDASYVGGGFASDGYSGVAPTDAIMITGSVFTNNTADSSGGGVALYDNYVPTSVDTTTVSGNEVTGAGSSVENGGGIWIEDTYNGFSTILSNSTITDNSTPDAGGGVSFGENFYGTTQVVNSTVAGNHSDDAGGGIQFADNDVPFELIDSTVTGNSAVRGGGVFRGYAGGGNTSDSSLDVSSSVLSGNTASGTGADFAESANVNPGSDLTVGNSLVQNVTGVTYTADPAGSNIIGADPKLGALADNGGPTQTRLPDPASPLVDAGLANGLTKDQRGLARTVDYPGVPLTNGSDGTDIGAAELGLPTPDTTVLDPFLSIESPQKQGKKKIRVKIQAGAGEHVNAQVYGVIRIGKGNAVMKTQKVSVGTGQRVTITVKPKTKKATKRILKALAKGRKVRAEVTGKLVDDNSNEYTKDLTAKLKPK